VGLSASFIARLNDEGAAVASDLESPSDTLLVAFGGRAGGLGIPPFDFIGLTADISTKRLFLRDLRGLWYQRGVPGMGDDADTLCEHLRRVIDESGVRRAIFVGNSMGGYAALLFGALLDVHSVHAFSPVTFLHPLRRAVHLDFRFLSYGWALRRAGRRYMRYADLKRVLNARQFATPLHVYFSTAHRGDSAHVRRIAGCPHVVLHRYAEGGHLLARHLRDTGELRQILRGALLT